MDPRPRWTWHDWLGLYGAVLSTAAVVVGWVLLYRQRGRLRIEGSASYVGPPPFQAPQDRIWLTITNVGGKPVHIVWVGWRLRKRTNDGKRDRTVMEFEPRKIEPEEQIVVAIFEPQQLHRNVGWIGVRDARGRLFKLSRLKLRRLIRDRERRMQGID